MTVIISQYPELRSLFLIAVITTAVRLAASQWDSDMADIVTITPQTSQCMIKRALNSVAHCAMGEENCNIERSQRIYK